jgi:hypothetical protein
VGTKVGELDDEDFAEKLGVLERDLHLLRGDDVVDGDLDGDRLRPADGIALPSVVGG